MWFLNWIANPFVRLILRSPFHSLMDSAILLISYKGVKSGKTYTLPVQYAQEEKNIYIIPGMAQKKVWWRSLRNGSQVKLLLKGRLLSAHAVVLQGPSETDQIVRAMAVYLKRFPESAAVHNIQADGAGSFNPDDILRAASSTIIVKVQPENS